MELAIRLAAGVSKAKVLEEERGSDRGLSAGTYAADILTVACLAIKSAGITHSR